jgi:hypothetical protein
MSADTQPTTAGQLSPMDDREFRGGTEAQGFTESVARLEEGPPWKRIGLWRCFLHLMIPTSILSVISGSLWLGIHFSGRDDLAAIQFWFYFFDVGREINVPTWFSAGLWIIAAALAGYFSRHASRYRSSWVLFSAVCIAFSIDETLELHERLDVIGAEIAQYLPLELGFTWVIPGALIAALVVGLLLRMVLSLPRGSRNGLIAAGVVFACGGLGVETLSGLFLEGDGLPWQFFLLTLIEETLEMAGIALCIGALVHLIARRQLATGVTAYRVADTDARDRET